MAPLPFSYRVGVAIITNLLLVVAVCDKGLRGGSSEASPPTLLNPPSLDLPQGVSLISSFGQKDGLMEETPGRISVIGFAKDDHGGLPLGNGDVTASVWVSPTGAINIGIGKSDAWDANGQLYKVANISLSLEGSENPQELQPVNTTLFFRRGEIHVEIGGIVVQILVDQQRPIVWIRSTAPAGRARRLTATLHPLRTSQEAMEWFTQPLQFCQQRFSQVDEFLGLLEGPFRDGVGIRNSGGSSAWLADSLSMQGLEGAPVYDAVSNRTFGGVLLGSGLVPHTLGSVIGEVSSATVLQVRGIGGHTLRPAPKTPGHLTHAAPHSSMCEVPRKRRAHGYQNCMNKARLSPLQMLPLKRHRGPHSATGRRSGTAPMSR